MKFVTTSSCYITMKPTCSLPLWNLAYTSDIRVQFMLYSMIFVRDHTHILVYAPSRRHTLHSMQKSYLKTILKGLVDTTPDSLYKSLVQSTRCRYDLGFKR